MAATSAREENVYMAKLAEQAERYEEMVQFMEKVTAEAEELTVEERNLLSVAYKNVIGARRASWRIISSIEQKEESRGNEDHVATIRGYRSKIESELSSICDGILRLLDSRLIPSATSGDSKVFYLKMKGDYHRYLAEFKTGAERKEAAESTLAAYKSAQVRSCIRVRVLLGAFYFSRVFFFFFVLLHFLFRISQGEVRVLFFYNVQLSFSFFPLLFGDIEIQYLFLTPRFWSYGLSLNIEYFFIIIIIIIRRKLFKEILFED